MARILVIDDDAQVRGAVRRILERALHTVEDVADGNAGLRAHHERPADLIITDIFMPERDGIETIRELRRQSPQVKIIVISGGDRTHTLDLRKDAELLGASRTLRKPFELTELLRAVGELLEQPSPGS
jgi:two-component system, chemotaxis family, chemotaxis protein CheY